MFNYSKIRAKQNAEIEKVPLEEKIRREISVYLADVEILEEEELIDVAKYYTLNQHNYCHLIVLARKYLCIPATSSPVERLFSYSGFIYRPHRSNLKTEKLEKLAILKTMSVNEWK